MDCLEARKRMQLYLDSELEAETSLEIERHLESCPECHEMFRAEEAFNQQMANFLSQGERTESLWRRIESKLEAGHNKVGLRSLWPFALAASVAALLLLWLWPRTKALELASAAEECHQAYVHRIVSPEFIGPVPEKIARQLGQKLDPLAFSCQPSLPGFTSEGGRVCHVGDVPSAVILGAYEKVPVSVIVFRRGELEHFPETKQRLESGEPVVCSRAGRYQLAVRLVGDHVVCLIGALSRCDLEGLAKSVENPT